MSKRSILCAVLIAFSVFVAVPKALMYNAKADAKAEIVMEVTSGKMLHEANADKKLPMASTTKIMTAIIIIEDCNLDEVITVPNEAVGVEGSSVYLKRGEEISIKDLLYGLMLRSGNDCAAALAIRHSGSIVKFADCMNEKAKKIGVKNTHFCNPSGLPDDNHYTTARDLCTIACYAMKNVEFKKIVGTTDYVGQFRSYTNKNKMLYNYEGATGVKTGYTVKAGRCLVSSAIKNGFEAVCVVLNCPDMYERSGELLDECFSKYKRVKIDKNKVFMCGIVPCKLLKTEELIVKNDGDYRFEVEDLSKSNVSENQFKGILRIYDKNDLIFKEKLYSIDYEK